ncbi:class I SAM-dependent methyltransferase [Phycicoccus avicenniae]|uniref:class I SAM-dependent methyltransferase n=1 Tax=Phycicoccus avicenniae TaxID=2828860 RepID=UPI003D288851
MSTRSRIAADAIEQAVWRARALPVRAGSLLAPGTMVRRATGARKVHLGCGPHLLDGWANLDMGGPPGVVRFDLSRPLPFPTGGLVRIYTEHFVEHLRREQVEALFRECARTLAPDGVLRVSTPDLRVLVAAYLEGRTGDWSDMQWTPASACDLLNEGMRLWGHLYVWDEEQLTASLLTAGFSRVERVRWRESEHEDLRGLESRPDHDDLIVEARP